MHEHAYRPPGASPRQRSSAKPEEPDPSVLFAAFEKGRRDCERGEPAPVIVATWSSAEIKAAHRGFEEAARCR